MRGGRGGEAEARSEEADEERGGGRAVPTGSDVSAVNCSRGEGRKIGQARGSTPRSRACGLPPGMGRSTRSREHPWGDDENES